MPTRLPKYLQAIHNTELQPCKVSYKSNKLNPGVKLSQLNGDRLPLLRDVVTSEQSGVVLGKNAAFKSELDKLLWQMFLKQETICNKLSMSQESTYRRLIRYHNLQRKLMRRTLQRYDDFLKRKRNSIQDQVDMIENLLLKSLALKTFEYLSSLEEVQPYLGENQLNWMRHQDQQFTAYQRSEAFSRSLRKKKTTLSELNVFSGPRMVPRSFEPPLESRYPKPSNKLLFYKDELRDQSRDYNHRILEHAVDRTEFIIKSCELQGRVFLVKKPVDLTPTLTPSHMNNAWVDEELRLMRESRKLKKPEPSKKAVSYGPLKSIGFTDLARAFLITFLPKGIDPSSPEALIYCRYIRLRMHQIPEVI
ncbi:hypothetical protein Ciccas_010503 [Cichlidogyrus casuarinus]|uniref:Uncharacterized protein n=1 Tax=Cichlidogyrus casuarinus TaxID=1844966 RepID=A0ABD2PV35_9PLAT